MSLVYAGACSHGPGITGRADRAEPEMRDAFFRAFRSMGEEIRTSGAEALVVIAAEHFANFFMNNMPSLCVGMAEEYEGPIEDPDWLGIPRTTIPGNPDLSLRLIKEIMQTSDIAYAEEWKFDHGIMVPLSFLTPEYQLPIIPVNINCQGPPLIPLQRAYEFGRSLRRAIDSMPERIAIVATGGISHWPATPDSGKINVEWDLEFLDRFIHHKTDELLSYSDEDTYLHGGQGGFEIRTYVALAGATEDCRGELTFYEPIPIFATGAVIAKMLIG